MCVCVCVQIIFSHCHTYRSHFAVVAVQQLCQEGVKLRGNVDWLYVLPLYHFLRGDCEPYGTPDCNPERILADFEATAKELGLDNKYRKSLQGCVRNGMRIHVT